MVMPIDDRIINRAHGVFDNMSMKSFRINRVEKKKKNSFFFIIKIFLYYLYFTF